MLFPKVHGDIYKSTVFIALYTYTWRFIYMYACFIFNTCFLSHLIHILYTFQGFPNPKLECRITLQFQKYYLHSMNLPCKIGKDNYAVLSDGDYLSQGEQMIKSSYRNIPYIRVLSNSDILGYFCVLTIPNWGYMG